MIIYLCEKVTMMVILFLWNDRYGSASGRQSGAGYYCDPLQPPAPLQLPTPLQLPAITDLRVHSEAITVSEKREI